MTELNSLCAVVNRGKEFRKPANDPFGQPGTRCLLFDPLSEEPYGTTMRNSNEVSMFKCAVGSREGWRYALDVCAW